MKGRMDSRKKTFRILFRTSFKRKMLGKVSRVMKKMDQNKNPAQ